MGRKKLKTVISGFRLFFLPEKFGLFVPVKPDIDPRNVVGECSAGNEICADGSENGKTFERNPAADFRPRFVADEFDGFFQIFHRKIIHCLTIPLLMNPATGQKFGKSIGGTSVWLDPARTTVFDYYQFWRNCDDSMIADLMKKFALDIPVEEADALVNSGNINRAKEILAYEATRLAHGDEEAAKAYIQAGLKFGFADPENKIPTTSSIAKISAASTEVELPTAKISAALFEGEGVGLAKLIVEAGLAKSTSDARRLVQGNAVSIDDVKANDVNKHNGRI